MICGNGLIVGDELFCRKIRHQGNAIEKVVRSANEIVELIPASVEVVNDWKSTELNITQRLAYAQAAASLKWSINEIPVNAEKLLSPRRGEDTNKNDVWTTFNVIQENLIKGGQRFRVNGGLKTTRRVDSVNENIRLNTALWVLTQKLRECLK